MKSCRSYSELMVARGGIEPPTRGFSVLANLHPGTPSVTQIRHLGEVTQSDGDGSCFWVMLGELGLGTKVETESIPTAARIFSTDSPAKQRSVPRLPVIISPWLTTTGGARDKVSSLRRHCSR